MRCSGPRLVPAFHEAVATTPRNSRMSGRAANPASAPPPSFPASRTPGPDGRTRPLPRTSSARICAISASSTISTNTTARCTATSAWAASTPASLRPVQRPGRRASYRSLHAKRPLDLVVRYGGSLSGEHGDGQSRRSCCRKMFGRSWCEAFREFKAIWDPTAR